jgi:hypothetical protein
MTGSPVTGLVRGWVRLYTSGLPAELRDARRDEVDDDLWCEHAEAAAIERSARSLDAAMALRLVLGIPADLTWRLTYHPARGPVASDRITAINTRILGLLATAAGSSLGLLLILSSQLGDALWTTYPAMMVVIPVVIGFSVTALGLGWRFHDGIGPLGAIGAIAVPLSWVFGPPANIAVLSAGSAMLMWDLARVGVLSRRMAITNVVAAILLTGLGLLPALLAPGQASFGAGAGLTVLSVSWIGIGVSLLRGLPRAPRQGADWSIGDRELRAP